MATIDELARQNAMYIEGAKAKAKTEPVAVEPTPVAASTIAPDLSGQMGYGEQMRKLGGVLSSAPGNAIKTLVSAPGYGLSAEAPAPQPAAPIVTPGVSPTGGISKLAAAPPPVPPVGAIQAQAAQAGTAPAAAPTPIQKIGVRRPPLNVPLQQGQPAAQPGMAPAVAQDLPDSPIAYVAYGGNNSTQVAYKDGRAAEIMQGQAMPEDVKAFNLISQQAGQQGGNVNVMRGMPETYNKDGTMRSAGGVQQTLALPAKPGEAFMREVPVELGGNIAAIGKYQAAQSQGAINNADPTTATNVQRDKELAATLANAQSVASTHAGATLGSAGISAGASKYSSDVHAKSALDVEGSRSDAVKKNLVMNPEQVGIDLMGAPIIKDVPYIRNADGTLKKAIQSSAAPASAPPPQAAAMLKSNPKLAADFDKKYGEGASKQILGK